MAVRSVGEIVVEAPCRQRPGLIQKGHGVLYHPRGGVNFAFDAIQITGHLRRPADIGLELQHIPHRRGIIRRFADPNAGGEFGLRLGHAVLERCQVVQKLAPRRIKILQHVSLSLGLS